MPTRSCRTPRRALRSAKSTGEKYLPHRLELSSAVVSRMTMEHRLRAAVERQEFELHYQTEGRRPHRQIRGLEALVRWRDPEAGLVMPGAFLPLMETSGLIVPLGDWILRQAASDLRRWQGAGLVAAPRGREHLARAIAPPRVCRSSARPRGRVAQREHRHRHRDHRGRPHRRRELRRLTTSRAAPLGRPRGHRRLRHGLFLVEPARRAARRHAQDRPQFRQRPDHAAAPAGPWPKPSSRSARPST